MALTTHHRPSSDSLSATDDTPAPTPPSNRGIAGWALAVTGAAAAAVLAIAVVQSGSDDPSPASHRLLIEQGSIRAIDGAAVAPSAAAPASDAAATGGEGNHSLLIEHGSIRAIEHADEAQDG